MAKIDFNFCDVCGKRTNTFYGRLTLFDEPPGAYSKHTKRSWRVCKKCFNNLSAMQTIGDELKEQLELYIDKFRVKNNSDKILEIGKKC